MQEAHALHAAALQRHIGHVHGADDIAVLQIVLQLTGGHDGAVLLALRGGGAQMGHGDDVGGLDDLVVGEVGDIGGDPAGVQSGDHGVVIHDLAAGQIDEPDAPLHGAEGLGVDHVAGGIGEVDVDGDIVGLLIQLLDVLDHVDVAVQTQGGIHGQVGVVAVDVHAQGHGHIGHQCTDGAQTDDAQRLVIQLGAYESGLGFFHQTGHFHASIHLFTDPADGTVHIAGGDQHAAQHQLLDGVGVGTGGGEDHDALFRAAVQRDIVHAAAGTGNGQQVGGEIIVVQLGGADQNGMLVAVIVADVILSCVEGAQTHGGDLVHGFDAVHGNSSKDIGRPQ